MFFLEGCTSHLHQDILCILHTRSLRRCSIFRLVEQFEQKAPPPYSKMDDKPPSPGHESDDTSREYKSITELIRAEFDDEQINGSKKLTRQEKIRQVEALINRPDVTKESFAHLDIKKIQKKIDWRLIPMLTLLYLLSNLDRGNIGNAKIEGLTEDLNMTGNDYNIALTVFFFTYAAFEVPSNMLLKKFRPSIWLPSKFQ